MSSQRVRRYSHVGECTLPLRVLAAQCTTLRNCYGTLLKRNGSVADRYGSLRDRYGTLTERYGTVTENIDFAYH